MAKPKKQAEYRVSVPVFSTEKTEGSFTYEEVINGAISKIEKYNNPNVVDRVFFVRKNKTQRKFIKEIETFKLSVGDSPYDVPVLLLKVHTFNTNILEGFTEEPNGERKKLNNRTKLGSEHNYLLLYPNLTGNEPNQKYNWLVLVYEDPNKAGAEIINTAKLVIGQILLLGMINIKPIDVLNKIKNLPVPVFEVKYTGLTQDDNGIDERLKQYLYSTKRIVEKKMVFKDVPFEIIEDYITDGFETSIYQKRETKFISGNNEYKIKKSLNIDDESQPEDEIQRQASEARALFKETAEQVFTDSFIIFESELDKVYDCDFIVEKLGHIIHNYIASYSA